MQAIAPQYSGVTGALTEVLQSCLNTASDSLPFLTHALSSDEEKAF